MDSASASSPAVARLFMENDLVQLAAALQAIGCPADKAGEMAAQLDKRAGQLSAQTGRSYEEAMSHLLGLMKQGWAAQERGL
jgi:hypothetical protein